MRLKLEGQAILEPSELVVISGDGIYANSALRYDKATVVYFFSGGGVRKGTYERTRYTIDIFGIVAERRGECE